MKKHLFTVLAGTLAFSLSAQVHYQESFNGLTLTNSASTTPYPSSQIPTNMVQINADGKPANASAEGPFTDPAYSSKAWACMMNQADTFAVSTSYINPPGLVNRWLITPPISGLTAASVLKWNAKAPDANYPDGYEVWVSVAAGANTTPVVADFTGTASNKVFTIAAEDTGWVSHNVSLAVFAGQTVRIAFRNNSNDMNLLFIDDIMAFVAPPIDIDLVSLSPAGSTVWAVVNSGTTLGGTVQNLGSTPITAFTAYYTDGTINSSSNFTGLNITYGQSYNFTFTTPYTITSLNSVPMKVWVDLSGDPTHSNDTLNTTLKGCSFVPNHKVVFEEATGTWCGWCVRGLVYMDSINKVYPNTTVVIAVHDGDPMTDAVYDGAMSTLVGGYPNVMADRLVFSGDPSQAFTAYNAHINDFGLADLTLTPSYNTTTRVATVSVDAKMAVSIATNNSGTDDYRLAVVFTEDGVTGTGSTWDQHNYYSGGADGPMSGAGHDFAAEPDPVPAANMVYDFVARTILGGFTGQANSLPSNLVAGTTYNNNTFTYTVPAAYNVDKMKVHALIIDAKNNIIYNANSVSLTVAGIPSQSEKMDLAIYPNPASTTATIKLNLAAAETVSITVYNAIGEVVYSEVKNSLPEGESKILLNTQHFANGMYHVSISSAHGLVTKKLSIHK